MPRRLGVLHVHRVGERLGLPQIADDKLPDRERIAAAVGTHDVEGGVVNSKLLNDGGWAAEVRAASRGKILVIRGASRRRYDNVQSRDVYQTHTLAKKQQIEPGALNSQVACGAERGKVGRGVAAQSDVRGHKAWVGEVDPVVMADL